MIDWADRIPSSILPEIDEIRNHTKRSNKEASITVCKLNNKNYTGGDETGKELSTGVAECRTHLGQGDRVGDIHTHPVHDKNWGGSILPSVADFTSYVDESFADNSRQIGCVTNHHAPYIQCVQPKSIPDRKKKNEYERAYNRQTAAKKKEHVSLDDPYFQSSIPNDFDIAFYDKDSGTRIKNPEPKKVISCALGKSNRRFRHSVKTMEKGAFCRMIQDYTVPHDDKIGEECRDEIKTRKILGGVIEY
jgi:hypothetical protein